MKAYQDKIYNKLINKSIQKKILNGSLESNEYDHPEVYQFLKLLTQEKYTEYRYQPITIEEWKTVVRKLKKQSSSSIFSKRNYSLYKCSIASDLFTNLLVKYYNIIFIKQFYLSHWIKILDIILEKGKGSVLGQLRTIQLIEADFQLLMRIFLKVWNKG